MGFKGYGRGAELIRLGGSVAVADTKRKHVCRLHGVAGFVPLTMSAAQVFRWVTKVRPKAVRVRVRLRADFQARAVILRISARFHASFKGQTWSATASVLTRTLIVAARIHRRSGCQVGYMEAKGLGQGLR